LIKDFPDIVKTPGLALECSMASIQPSKIRNSKGLWDEEVVDTFRKMLSQINSRVEGTIFSVTKSGSGHSKFVVSLESVEVTLGNNLDVLDVKEELLKAKFAEAAVESFLSQQDHRERMRFTAYNEAMKKHLQDYKSVLKVPQLAVKEDKSKLIMKTPLSGPYSPLEHKILCVYRHGAGKMANIDLESVNTVMLDQAPCDPHDHWLVAAHVGVNPGGDSLQLRNTSWLPARPGLGALSTMIFAPQVEVRTNTKKSRLTGFVAGLGPKTAWDKPEEEITKVERTLAFYPEHDMEVKFDVNITNQDINTVNKVRYWVNQMISKTEDGMMVLTQPRSLDEAQKGIRRNLEDLLERERKYEEKESLASGREYRWNMLSPGMRLQSQLADQEKYVYKMIDGVKLSLVGDNKVMEKLISLYSKADRMSLTLLPNTEVCPACPGQLKLTTPRDIWAHFNSEQHKQVETMLVQASEQGTSSYAGSVTSGK
jgi:ATP-dependent RNA helicase TDRD9